MMSIITNMGVLVPLYDAYFDKLDEGQKIVMSYQEHIMTFEKTPNYIFTEENNKESKSKKTHILDRNDIIKIFNKYERSKHTVRYCDYY